MTFYRLAALAVAAMAVAAVGAPMASAQPDPPVDPAGNAAPPPPPNGDVPSAPPSVVTTPDGWELTVTATDETQLAIAPLTTALSSREYLVGGTFTGKAAGSGDTSLAGGTFEIGYQIGCGIAMDKIKLNGSIGIGAAGSRIGALVPTGDTLSIQGQIEVNPKPGEVINVSVDKKEFKAKETRVTLKDVHVKIDSCVGQSFLRSYAILTSKSADTDDVVAYYGVTKVV